ncbi:MAG: hypothetical protein ACRDS9_27445, partial [Pseudonocardiaceae bacterium]
PSAARPRRRRQRVFPSNNHQLWVCGWVEDAGRIPADVEDELRAAELDHDSDVSMFVWSLGRGDELRVFDGDGAVLYELPPRTSNPTDGRRSAKVGKIVRVITVPGSRPRAIVAFDGAHRGRKLRSVLDVYDEHGQEWDPEVPLQPGTGVHTAVLDLWRL